jgi:hypothetical protein
MCIVLEFAPKDECKGAYVARPAKPGTEANKLEAKPARQPALAKAGSQVHQRNGRCGFMTAAPKSIEHTYSFLIFHGMA